MTEEQARTVANIRKLADERVIDHSSLTDEQILKMNEALKRFADGFRKCFVAICEQFLQRLEPIFTVYKAEMKRQRRQYYRKKKSQSKRKP